MLRSFWKLCSVVSRRPQRSSVRLPLRPRPEFFLIATIIRSVKNLDPHSRFLLPISPPLSIIYDRSIFSVASHEVYGFTQVSAQRLRRHLQSCTHHLFSITHPPETKNERPRPPHIPRLARHWPFPSPHDRQHWPPPTPPRIPKTKCPRHWQETAPYIRHVVAECIRQIPRRSRHLCCWTSSANRHERRSRYGSKRRREIRRHRRSLQLFC